MKRLRTRLALLIAPWLRQKKAWHHIAVTHDEHTKLYLDGEQVQVDGEWTVKGLARSYAIEVLSSKPVAYWDAPK